MRVCRVATVPFIFATMLREQVRRMVGAGIDVTLVCSPGGELDEMARTIPVRCRAITMARPPDPRRDLGSLWELIRFFQRERFDIVHSTTPKAGLLSVMAAGLARTPIRLHTYTGQPWTELRGFSRRAARTADAVIGRWATRCYADSASQRDFLVAEGIVAAEKIAVFGEGSIGGVDLKRFSPPDPRRRILQRRELGLGEDSVVIIFVGRATNDKGINELAAAFSSLQERHKTLHLLLVGPQEPSRDPLPAITVSRLASNPRVRMTGFIDRPEDYLAAADIFCLPSYREGFGSAVIEAGAMGLPTVATRITGLVDAVVEGETGLLVPAKDVPALTEALGRMIESPELRFRMGQAARRRAEGSFDAEIVDRMVIDEYFRLEESARARGLASWITPVRR